VKPLWIHPEAQAELFAAAEFYSSQAEGLGADFVVEVTESSELIRALPLAADEVGLRRSYLPRFPFTIV
jgi:hypothetical protein